jgi:hypothetical protein
MVRLYTKGTDKLFKYQISETAIVKKNACIRVLKIILF